MLTPVGFGAGGAVWRARDETGRTVVVSFLQLPPGDRGTALLRRLAALRSTCHPHLPRVLDVVGLGDDRCALVTDEVAGPTLTTVRTAGGALTPGAARTLLTALGSALAKLHTRGVIHGDVAPDNIVITAGGVPVLVDLAGEVSTERGTPGFAAPEVRTGAAAGAAADVWALAEVVRWASGDHPDVARILAPALSTDVATRPSAEGLATAAAGLGAVEHLELPPEADLAQARLRSGQDATQRRADRRPRGRHRRRTRRGRHMALVAAGLSMAVAVTGMATRWAGGAEPLGEDDVQDVVTALVAARDRALASGDAQALGELTEPGSELAAADAALVADLGRAGVRPDGLRTRVNEVAALGVDGEGRRRVRVVTRQGEYTLSGRGESDGVVVPASEPRCTVMVIAGPPWRVAATEECG